MSRAAGDADHGSDSIGLVLLGLGVVSVGAAALLIRLADAHPLTAAFVRLSVGGAVLTGSALSRRCCAWPRGVELRRAVVAGVLLGVHFALWIASLSFTTVTASVVLVCLQPVFLALLARVVLRETTSPRVLLGIGVALVGAVAIATDGAHGTGSLGGNLLALGGALAIAVYVLVLRAQRGDVVTSAAVITSVAAAVVLPACLAARAPLLPSSTTQAGWLLALALGPQVIGHTALNAALRRLPAAIVSGSILGEPVIASALAWMVLDERPRLQTLIGGAVTLIGVGVLVSRATGAPPGANRS